MFQVIDIDNNSPGFAASISTSASRCATSLLTSRWRMVKSAMRALSHASSLTDRQIPLVTNRGPQSHPYSYAALRT